MDEVKTWKFECPNCGKEIETDEFDSYTMEKRYCRKCQKFVRFRLHNYLKLVKDPEYDFYYIMGPYITNLN